MKGLLAPKSPKKKKVVDINRELMNTMRNVDRGAAEGKNSLKDVTGRSWSTNKYADEFDSQKTVGLRGSPLSRITNRSNLKKYIKKQSKAAKKASK